MCGCTTVYLRKTHPITVLKAMQIFLQPIILQQSICLFLNIKAGHNFGYTHFTHRQCFSNLQIADDTFFPTR
jgi:hypothetical protein